MCLATYIETRHCQELGKNLSKTLQERCNSSSRTFQLFVKNPAAWRLMLFLNLCFDFNLMCRMEIIIGHASWDHLRWSRWWYTQQLTCKVFSSNSQGFGQHEHICRFIAVSMLSKPLAHPLSHRQDLEWTCCESNCIEDCLSEVDMYTAWKQTPKSMLYIHMYKKYVSIHVEQKTLTRKHVDLDQSNALGAGPLMLQTHSKGLVRPCFGSPGGTKLLGIAFTLAAFEGFGAGVWGGLIAAAFGVPRWRGPGEAFGVPRSKRTGAGGAGGGWQGGGVVAEVGRW